MLNRFLSSLRRARRYWVQSRDLSLIRNSGLFDERWYLAHYPDITGTEVDPLLHYYQHGGFEDRDPGPKFSSNWYLNAYKDVKKAGINPLVHYLKYGRTEGRSAHIASVQLHDIHEATLAKSFLSAYISEVASNIYNAHEDNYDTYRFGPPIKELHKITPRTKALDILQKGKPAASDFLTRTFVSAIELIEPFLSRFDDIFTQLADNESRNIYIKVLAYRALGYQKVKLPLNKPDYWNGIKTIESLANFSNSISYPFSSFNWTLPLIDLQQISVPVHLYATAKSVYTQFVLEQYKCVSGQTTIGIEKGDTVIDTGACWGDTTLYFAHHAGQAGKVFSYEFVPRNLEIFFRNLDLNPQLRDRVSIVDRAAWSHSGQMLQFGDNGPGSSVISSVNNNKEAIETLSIDDLVEVKKIARVDFIKMDIEGSELKALQGAVNTIRKDRPKLAISIYHQLSDFVEIAEFLISLNLGYRFYIRHYTIHAEETILFARTA
jgi:FkbM family methyltransferase